MYAAYNIDLGAARSYSRKIEEIRESNPVAGPAFKLVLNYILAGGVNIRSSSYIPNRTESASDSEEDTGDENAIKANPGTDDQTAIKTGNMSKDKERIRRVIQTYTQEMDGSDPVLELMRTEYKTTNGTRNRKRKRTDNKQNNTTAIFREYNETVRRDAAAVEPFGVLRREIECAWALFISELFSSIFFYGYAAVYMPKNRSAPMVVPPTVYYVLSEPEWIQNYGRHRSFPRRHNLENYVCIFYDPHDEEIFITDNDCELKGRPFVFCETPPKRACPGTNIMSIYMYHTEWITINRSMVSSIVRNSNPTGFYSVQETEVPPGIMGSVGRSVANSSGVRPVSLIPRSGAGMGASVQDIGIMYQQYRQMYATMRMREAMHTMIARLRANESIHVAPRVRPRPSRRRHRRRRDDDDDDDDDDGGGGGGDVDGSDINIHASIFKGADNSRVFWTPEAKLPVHLVDILNHLKQNMALQLNIPPTMLNIPMQQQRAGTRDLLIHDTFRRQIMLYINKINDYLAVICLRMSSNSRKGLDFPAVYICNTLTPEELLELSPALVSDEFCRQMSHSMGIPSNMFVHPSDRAVTGQMDVKSSKPALKRPKLSSDASITQEASRTLKKTA